MNNTEDWSDLDKIIHPKLIFQDGKPRQFYTKEQLQKHTNQTLQDLKVDLEKLRKYEYKSREFEETKKGRKYYKETKYAVLLEDILQLIDEAMS